MQGKRILLGISGGIAAYKIANLIRIFIKSGAEVRCIMTPASVDFITPLTVATLSKNEVYVDFWDKKSGTWSNHVELGLWADLFIIAPLTANSLGKMANGLSDNLLLAAYLSARCPVFIAPAMDLDMYNHPTTKRNLDLLESDGVLLLPAQSGELASGLEGVGRMMEPESIFEFAKQYFSTKERFDNRQILITAGPTHEAIDPVRYIGNSSTGRMGIELALNLANQGAKIHLILGPSNLSVSHKNIVTTPVRSADEMLKAVQEKWFNCSVGIFAAAVADYRPAVVATEKIKKKEENLSVELVKNPDILLWAGQNKQDNQFLMGFALETNNEVVNAKEKRVKKNLDAIVLNSLQNEGAGFAHPTNKISIFDKHNNHFDFELKSKRKVAQDIADFLYEQLKKNEKYSISPSTL